MKQNHDVLEGKDKKEFLKGAEIAYETILTAFANGDVKKLRDLLTPTMNNNIFTNIPIICKFFNRINMRVIRR